MLVAKWHGYVAMRVEWAESDKTILCLACDIGDYGIGVGF